MTEADALKKLRPMTVWLTGLSGSGKSTLAQAMVAHAQFSTFSFYVLDGDILRTGLCNGLGFSAVDRRENIRRVAEAAKLLNGAGVNVVCALISPAGADREMAAEIIGEDNFMEVYVATPLIVCESRDPKGLYKRARAGEIPLFTGINSPYEPPTGAALVLENSTQSVEDSINQIARCIDTWRSTQVG
jgi:adenylyl-sulfate kinase